MIDSELMKVRSVGIGSTNSVIVDRAYYGTTAAGHTVGATVTVMRGDFNIVKDTIYFTDPPYGKIGQESLQVNSSFQGRLFSRRFDPGKPSDKNLIIDDISKDFTGKAETVGIKTGTLNSSSKNIISGIITSSLSLGDVLKDHLFLMQTKFIPLFEYSCCNFSNNFATFAFFEILLSIVSTSRGSAAAKITASISLSRSLILVGKLTTLSFLVTFAFLIINFPYINIIK